MYSDREIRSVSVSLVISNSVPYSGAQGCTYSLHLGSGIGLRSAISHINIYRYSQARHTDSCVFFATLYKTIYLYRNMVDGTASVLIKIVLRDGVYARQLSKATLIHSHPKAYCTSP